MSGPLASTVNVLEIPTQMGFTAPTPILIPSEVAKIAVEGQVFDIEDSPTTSSVLGRLRRAEDGSYRLPDDWDVHATQFSAFSDLLHSAK